MRLPNPLKILTLGLLALIAVVTLTAVAAANTVPPTRLTQHTFPIGPNDLKPSACAGIYLTNIVIGSGTINGTSGNDLILGSSGDDTINGMGGDDCIVAGAGNDKCTGSGNTVFISCEVQTKQ